MSRLSTVVRSSLPYLAAFVVGFAMVFSAGVLMAQDSAIVHDRTGLFGPIIDKFWPVIVTFLTSLTVKLIAKANAVFARTGEPVNGPRSTPSRSCITCSLGGSTSRPWTRPDRCSAWRWCRRRRRRWSTSSASGKCRQFDASSA